MNEGRRKELYHFRDQQGLEVDFLFPSRDGRLWMVECKASRTVHPSMAGPMLSLRKSVDARTPARLSVVHRVSTSGPSTRAVAPGVEALDVRGFSEALSGPAKRARGRK